MGTIETRGTAEAPSGRIGSGGEAECGLTPGGDPERHPTIDNVNALLTERLSPTEHICRRIAAMSGRRPVVKGCFEAVVNVSGAVMSTAC